MPITQQRMLNLIASAEHYESNYKSIRNEFVALNERVIKGEISPEDALQQTGMLFYVYAPVAERVEALVKEKQHFKNMYSTNNYERERQRRARVDARAGMPHPKMVDVPLEGKLLARMTTADNPLEQAIRGVSQKDIENFAKGRVDPSRKFNQQKGEGVADMGRPENNVDSVPQERLPPELKTRTWTDKTTGKKYVLEFDMTGVITDEDLKSGNIF